MFIMQRGNKWVSIHRRGKTTHIVDVQIVWISSNIVLIKELTKGLSTLHDLLSHDTYILVYIVHMTFIYTDYFSDNVSGNT